jgi:hypothetical protein
MKIAIPANAIVDTTNVSDERAAFVCGVEVQTMR